jgi:hypothetical protein
MKVQAREAPGIYKGCYLDCGRVTVFPSIELAAAEDQGSCTPEFLLRVIDEVENRARTLTALQRCQIAQTLRDIVEPKTEKDT